MLSNNNWHKLHNFWKNHIVNRVFVTFYAMALLICVSDLEWAINILLYTIFQVMQTWSLEDVLNR